MLLCLALAALAVTVGAALVARRILGGVDAVRRSLEALAAGDPTVAAVTSSRDEIGEMAASLERARSAVGEIVATVASSADAVASASAQLSASSQRIAAGAEETSVQAGVASTAADEVSRNVHTVAAGAEEMGASIREIAHPATEDIARRVDSIQADTGSAVDAKISTVAAAADSTTQAVNQTLTASGDLAAMATTLRQGRGRHREVSASTASNAFLAAMRTGSQTGENGGA